MSFWDVIWAIVIASVFAGYLVLLFFILRDLLRDPNLSGWTKAGWLIAIYLLPFLTGFAYILARGTGIHRRQAEWKAGEMVRAEALMHAGTRRDAKYAGMVQKVSI
jgi:hypothetical protein